jgi:2-C-methyl-D-erythritol 2,4-cyclodiphosphate synthase
MKVGIGQDSHKFLSEDTKKTCIIGGVSFEDVPGFSADSDGDIVYHAICNAISSITHAYILGDKAITMCKEGVTDSKYYLLEAKNSLHKHKIHHISISIEAKRPRLQSSIYQMRKNVAEILDLDLDQVGITCTSGNNLGDFGRGEGVQAIAIVTIS